MSSRILRGTFAALALVAWALSAALPAAAATSQFRILLDLDNDTTTGCTVTTVDGLFPGVEQILLTTVATSGSGGSVTAVERQECTDPSTDTFGPLISVDPGGWPVGVGNGTGGLDVVETYFPLSATPLQLKVVHLGVLGSDGGRGADAMLTTAPAGSDPILLQLQTLLEIPTLSEWGLLLLGLLLAALAVASLRRRSAVALLAALLVLGAAGVAWAACVLDGQTGDWNGLSPLATDGTGDAPEGADVGAFFGQLDGNRLCFRIDADLSFNQPPVADPQMVSTDEDTPLVVTLTGSDPDGDPLTFSITAGPTNGSLGAVTPLTPTSAQVTYTPAVDFNGADSFTFQVDDGLGGTDTAVVSITVNPVNDPPVVPSQTFTIPENSPNATSVGTVAFTDPDTGQTHSFAITAGNTGGAFAIDPSTGEITVADSTQLDFETTPSFSLTVQVTDDGTPSLAGSGTVTVDLANVNDPPVVTPATFSIAENSPNATSVGTVMASDPDLPAQTLTFAITAGNTGGAFAIDSSTGEITVADSTQLDFETTPSFSLTVQATDNGTPMLSGSATVTVDLTNVNEPPTVTAATFTVPENSPNATSVGTVSFSDPDAGQTLTLAITAGNTGGAFAINSSTGEITVADSTQLDFETTPSFSLTVQATDNGTPMLSGSATVTIDLMNVNEPPVAAADGYITAGNTELAAGGIAGLGAATVLSPTSVLANDSDPDSLASGFANLAVVPASGTTTKGGSFSIDALGRFRYTPPPGVLAPMVDPDTFPYTLTDGTNMVAGLVSVIVEQRIWYVKNDAAMGGNGTSSAPFDSLASVNGAGGAGDPDGPGDILFVFTGDGTTAKQNGGIELEGGQKLLGEGVGLTVTLGGNPVSLVAAGTKPKITNAAAGGDGVTVADIGGVEIRGLDIAGTDNAIDVTSSGAGSAGVTITDNAISGAGTQGIRLALGGSGTSVATVGNNTLKATGNAFDARTTAGELDLAFNTNTNIDSGATGVVVDGSGGGKAVVTSLSGDGVTAGASGGMSFTNVVFDADPATAAFDTVAGGNAAVGSSGTPVGSGGVTLANVSGDLSFTQLDVFNSGAGPAGIQVTGSGLFTGAAGFRLQAAAGTVSTGGGPALAATTATLATSFTALSSSMSPTTGISLTNTGGTLGSAGGSLSGSSGPAVVVSGGSTILNLAGMTVAPASGSMPALSGANSTGAFNLTGSTITKSGGRLIDFNNMDGGGSFATTTVTTTNHWGVRATNSNGTFGFPPVVIAAATPAAVDGAVFLQSNNAGFVGNFGKVDVAVSGTNRRGIVAINAGVVNITDGTSRATATGGAALDLRTSTIGGNAGGWVLQSISSTNSTQQGVNVNTVAGNLTINGGSISGATANAFDLNAGGSNVTYKGTISNSAAHSVEVTNHTGGTVSFTGAIGDTGTGISLATNGGSTMSFSGGLTLATTTNNAFSATGGGTVEVTGASNTAVTTTGTALTVTGTTIGASGITFRSITAGTGASGPTNGIVLDNTGTLGGLTVTGTGAAGSGGTIQQTDQGILLTQTRDVSLAYMNLLSANTGDGGGAGVCDGNTNAGCKGAINMNAVLGVALDNLTIDGAAEECINGQQVTHLGISNSLIQNCGNAVNEHGIYIHGLLGAAVDGATSSIANTTVRASNNDNVFITNGTASHPGDSANPDLLRVSGSTFRDLAAPNGANGLELRSTAMGNMRIEVVGSTFTNNRSTGLRLNGETGGALQADVSGSTFSSQVLGIESLLTQTSTLNFDIHDNPLIQTTTGSPINLVAFDSASFVGKVRNNPGISMDAGGNGNGIAADAEGAGASGRLLIDGNNITNNGFGIGIRLDTRTTGSARLDATVSNNVVTSASVSNDGMKFFAGNNLNQGTTMCVHYVNNQSTGGTGLGGYFVEQVQGSNFFIQGLTPATGATAAQVVSFIQGANTSGTARVSPAGGGIVVDYKDATCLTVP